MAVALFSRIVEPPADFVLDYYLLAAVIGGVLYWSIIGGAVGAALGALFQFIANAARRRRAEERTPLS